MSDDTILEDSPQGEDVERLRQVDTLEAQRQLIYLELYEARRRIFADPGLIRVTLGVNGQVDPEHTIRGDQRDPYNGVAILNPTSATLSVGFQAGTGYLAPLTVPPFSFVIAPERYTNLSLALLKPSDAAQTYTSPVTVLRLRVPPQPSAGPYGAPNAAPALAAANPGQAVNVTTAGTLVAAANPARRELTIVNGQSTGWVTLGLSSSAPAAWAGIPLAPGGGSYTTNEHDGAVSAIAHTATTTVSVAEV